MINVRQALITTKAITEERKGWLEFEVILFYRDVELYHDTLKARSGEHASSITLAFAQSYYPYCNRIHINPIQQ